MKKTKAVVLTIGFLMASIAVLSAQPITGKEVLARCEKSIEGVEDYTVKLRADLNMEGIRIPRSEAKMYFKKPDKVHFESPTFAMLPREGFGAPISMLIKAYDATVKGEEMLDSSRTYRLQLVAKDPAARLQQLSVWVNKSNWTVARTESVPYQGRSVKMDFAYQLVDGRYWLPVKMQVELKAPPADSTDAKETMAVPGAPQLGTMRRARRNGIMTIEYSDYRVNTGLSDELFKQQEGENR